MCPACNKEIPRAERSYRIVDPLTGNIRSVCTRCWAEAGMPDPPSSDAPAIGMVEVEVGERSSDVGSVPTHTYDDDSTEELPLPRRGRK